MDPMPSFLPTAYSGPVWEAAERQLARQRNDVMSYEELREEMAVRDLCSRFGYALDRGDVDGMMSLFAEDSTLSNPRGTCVGLEAIRADIETHFKAVRRRFHVWSNVVVRLAEGFQQGWVTANFFGVIQADGGLPCAAGGLAADEVVKEAGLWKIRSRSTTADLIGQGELPGHD